MTGPLVQERIRFWATVLHVETDAGRVWVKENAPSQAFEARLVATVDRLAPGTVAPVVAVEEEHGWLATADLGRPMWHDEEPPPVDDWVAVVADYARAQRFLATTRTSCSPRACRASPAGPTTSSRGSRYVLAELDELPDPDPRRLDRGGGGRRPRRAAAASTRRPGSSPASGLPDALQHNDLHLANAFRRPGGAAYIDLGDAVWAHPLTTLRIPLWIMRHRFSLGARRPGRHAARSTPRSTPWTDLADRDDLVAVLPAADRLSCLHRAESWRRLQSDVPASCVAEHFARSVPEWLVDATAPDPYASAVSR